MDFAATLLSRITRKDVSTGQIRENHSSVDMIIDRLMESSRSNKTVTWEYEKQKFAVSIGLPDRAENRMAAARSELNVYNAR